MAFSKTLAIFISALALAAAAPQGGRPEGGRPQGGPPGGSEFKFSSTDIESKCNAQQQLSCCNTSGGLLGLNCVIALIGATCGGSDTTAACCEDNDQTGLVNIGLTCSPISII